MYDRDIPLRNHIHANARIGVGLYLSLQSTCRELDHTKIDVMARLID